MLLSGYPEIRDIAAANKDAEDVEELISCERGADRSWEWTSSLSRTRLASPVELGVAKDQADSHGNSSKDAWWMSSSQAVHQALSVAYLAQDGLPSLLANSVNTMETVILSVFDGPGKEMANVGAIGFLVGSLLMLPETVFESES